MEVMGQLHSSVALLTEKRPRNLLNRKLGGLQRRCGPVGKEKNLLISV
jgi:hypothetical protein